MSEKETQDLLARLSALKPTTTVGTTNPTPYTSKTTLTDHPTKEDALSARLRSLRNASVEPDVNEKEKQKIPVKETRKPTVEDVTKLLATANMDEHLQDDDIFDLLEEDMPPSFLEEEGSELEYQKEDPEVHVGPEEVEKLLNETIAAMPTSDPESAVVSLPSVPSGLPKASNCNTPSLPSVPSGLPSTRSLPSVPSDPPQAHGSAATTPWCTLCSGDATLHCPSCAEFSSYDDSLYCTQCWFDMHKGPNANFDDSLHRAVSIVPGKKKEKKQRIALGA